jgi:hypothetical protein
LHITLVIILFGYPIILSLLILLKLILISCYVIKQLSLATPVITLNSMLISQNLFLLSMSVAVSMMLPVQNQKYLLFLVAFLLSEMMIWILVWRSLFPLLDPYGMMLKLDGIMRIRSLIMSCPINHSLRDPIRIDHLLRSLGPRCC